MHPNLQPGHFYLVKSNFSFLDNHFQRGQILEFIVSRYSPYDSAYGLEFRRANGDIITYFIHTDEVDKLFVDYFSMLNDKY